MNKYLEKIASKNSMGSLAVKTLRKHDLVETALDIKGRVDDIGSLHSKFKSNKPKKQRHRKHEILSPARHRSNRKTS